MNKTIKQMKRNKLLILFTILFVIGKIQAQQQVVFHIDQSDLLIANAGNDVSILPGNSVLIGGTPTAIDGHAPYYYTWTPISFLNDAEISNPTATPLETITYMVSLHDANNCSSKDSVLVKVDPSTGIFGLQNEKDGIPYAFYSSGSNVITIGNLSKEDFNVLVADISGKILFNQFISSKNNSVLKIPTYNMPHALIVTISGREKTYSYKLFKN